MVSSPDLDWPENLPPEIPDPVRVGKQGHYEVCQCKNNLHEHLYILVISFKVLSGLITAQ